MGLLDDHMKAATAAQKRDALWSEWFQRYRVDSGLVSVSQAYNPHSVEVLYEVDEMMGVAFLEVLDDFIDHLTLHSGTPGYAIDTPDGFQTIETPLLLKSADSRRFGKVVEALLQDGVPVRSIVLSTPTGVETVETWKLVFADDGGCFLAARPSLRGTANPFTDVWDGEVNPDLFARAVAAYLNQ